MSQRQLSPYEKPAVRFWIAEELDAIEATMSHGHGWAEPWYRIHVLFSGMHKSDHTTLIPLDHAALFISTSALTRDHGYFFSFGADDADRYAAVAGTEGYLSTNRTSSNAQTEIAYSDITGDGWEPVDFVRGGEILTGDPSSRYYREIHFGVDRATALGLFAEAQSKLGYLGGCYELVWHNCFDKVAEILATKGITIEYDWSGTSSFLYNLQSYVGVYWPAMANALAVSIASHTLDAANVNVPNLVWSGFTAVKRAGLPLPARCDNIMTRQ